MTRNTRLLIVLFISLGMAGAATYFVQRTIAQMPTREVEIARAYAVVAAKPLPLGARITPADVKIVAWPADSPVAGGFSTIEQVVNRGVIAPVVENEPITNSNLASLEAGAGLPPTIPPGMRAISVSVNEVVGVAGFVTPGTRVDVMVILRAEENALARVVVSNVQVLTAGTRYDQEAARDGKPIPTSVVTLLVSPQDAETIGLAATQGQVLLTLRNPLDMEATATPGTRASTLSGAPPRPVVEPRMVTTHRPAPAPVYVPPPPPTRHTVEVIRAAKRSEETVK